MHYSYHVIDDKLFQLFLCHVDMCTIVNVINEGKSHYLQNHPL
jgi:hypothetical protein